MRAQSLRHVVVIKRRADGRFPSGQPSTDWVQVGPQRRASILHASGATTLRGNAQISTVKASIRLRYCTDVLPGMRAHHGSVVYDIVGVLPDEVRRDHVDLVVERTT